MAPAQIVPKHTVPACCETFYDALHVLVPNEQTVVTIFPIGRISMAAGAFVISSMCVRVVIVSYGYFAIRKGNALWSVKAPIGRYKSQLRR